MCTRYGESWRPLSMPRGMWGAFCRMGVPRRLQYCRHKCRRLQYYLCQGGCEALLPQVYGVWSRYCGLTVHCLLRSPLVPSKRAPPIGWPQSTLAAPVGEERQASFLWVPGRRCGVGVGSSVLGQAFRSEGPPGGGWCPKRVLRSERWAEEVDERAPVFKGRPSGRRPDFPSGPLCFSFLSRPMKYMLFS